MDFSAVGSRLQDKSPRERFFRYPTQLPPSPTQYRPAMKGPIVTCGFHYRWDAGFRALSHFGPLVLPTLSPSKDFPKLKKVLYFHSLSSSRPVLLCHPSDERRRSSDLILTSAPGLITGNRLGRLIQNFTRGDLATSPGNSVWNFAVMPSWKSQSSSEVYLFFLVVFFLFFFYPPAEGRAHTRNAPKTHSPLWRTWKMFPQLRKSCISFGHWGFFFSSPLKPVENCSSSHRTSDYSRPSDWSFALAVKC